MDFEMKKARLSVPGELVFEALKP